MRKGKELTRRILSLLLVLAMILGGISTDGLAGVFQTDTAIETVDAAGNYGLADSVEDGVILHAWNWYFNDVKNNMADIAAAGYTAVQVSPIQPNKDGKFTSTKDWWKFYQPTDFAVGNTLGTASDFQAMCTEAHKYGIKIIVDVVANHLANVTGKGGNSAWDRSTQIPDWLRNNDAYWHGTEYGSPNDNDRKATTHGSIGMPDLNTSNKDLQNYILAFLNKAQELGADGFRFDAAKHIELPTDNPSSDFWPTIVNGLKAKDPDCFIYGEILNTAVTNINNYTKYMRVTNNKYGHRVQTAIRNSSAGTAQYMNHEAFGSNPYTWVTWVESHDTYAGEYGDKTVDISDENIALAWCLVASRAYAVPLFYVRPNVVNGSWGNSTIGVGKTTWKDPKVVAVNKFHNAIADEQEYVRILNNDKVYMVERGTSAACIVNLSYSPETIKTPTNLKNGTYTDVVNGSVFTVSNGTLTGRVNSRTAAVFYEEPVTEPVPTISQEGGNFSGDTLNLTFGLKNAASGTYKIGSAAAVTYTSSKQVSIGADMNYGDSVTVTLTATDGTKTNTKTFTFTKVETITNIAYLKLPSGWGTPYCYAYDSATETINNGTWPGAAMTLVGDGIYKYEVPDNIEAPRVMFYSSDTNRYPADKEKGLLLTGSMIYDGSTWTNYDGGGNGGGGDDDDTLIDGSYNVYFVKPSGWGSTIYCYAYESETSNNAAWPGAVMTSLGNGVYAYNLPSGWTSAKILFSDGSNQTPGVSQPGYDYTSGSSMKYENGSWSKVTVTVTEKTPKVTSSLANNTSFTSETKTITLTLSNATKGTYSVDGGPVKEFTGSAQVVLGQGKIADSVVTVEATATDGTTTKNFTFTYNKVYSPSTTLNASSVSYLASAALTGKYATNPNSQMGKYKTISSASDFTEDMIIAQGVANDDPRIFRGSHEGQVYDTYALYGAWDNTNLYLGWQFTNVTDVVDPAQGYPISDNGKPWNGDKPQMLLFNLGTGKTTDGRAKDTDSKTGAVNYSDYIWGLRVKYETAVDAVMCFSSKPGVGQPALFKADSDGYLNYDTAVGFTSGGISFKYEDGFFGSSLYGINSNGYAGYVPEDLTSGTAVWTDFLTTSHNKAQDTFYVMTIPLNTLGITRDYLESNGIGVMHISTFGQSGTASLPMDMTMLDNAMVPYSEDQSTSHEKEDVDTITVPLARLGAKGSGGSGGGTTTTALNVNFGADRSSPQADTTDLLLKAVAYGGTAPYTYQFSIDNRVVKAYSSSDTYTWDTKGGEHTISVTVKDSTGATVTSTKDYVIEGDVVDDPLQINSFIANVASPQLKGTSVKLTVNASGGTGTLKYKFYRVLDGNTKSYTFRDYSVSNTATCTNSVAGTYTIYVDVMDEAGNVATSKIRYTWKTQDEELKITGFTSDLSSPQATWTKVKLTATATGGSGTLEYKFYRVTGTTTTVFRDYAASNEAYCNPGAGDYTLYVDVKDAAGNVVTKSMNFSWGTVARELRMDSFTSDLQSPQAIWTRVKLTANASGGTGTLQYRFYRTIEGKTTVFRDYAASNEAYCNPGEGTYTLYADVKDGSGKVVTKSMPFTWGTAAKELTLNSFTSDLQSPQAIWTKVKLTASASGGTGTLQYRFYRTIEGKTTVFRDYAASNEAYCNPGEGTYTLYVDVKDGSGKVVTKSMPFTWGTAAKELTLNSFTSDLQSPQAIWTRVKLTANASGGTGTLQYRFYRTIGGKTTVFRDYAASNEAYCNPGEGTYTLYVDVKDGSGKVVTKSMPFTWGTIKKELSLDSFTADLTSPQPAWTKVKLTANASGGTGTLQYRFYRISGTNASIFRDYAASNEAYCNPGSGTYSLYVDVKDADGTVLTKSMNFVWK